MKATLNVKSIDCPHCKKEAIGNNEYVPFKGDSEPYIEEEQSGIITCNFCKKEIQIDVKFTVVSNI